MKIEISPHPQWIDEFLEFIAPYNEKVVHCRAFQDMANGTLSLTRFHGGFINFYPLVARFPKYLGAILTKVPTANSERNRIARCWLSNNIRVERLHAHWWKRWAVGFGVPHNALDGEIYPPREMDAINNYLWQICTRGSLIEAMAAANFAIEGPTGQWAKNVWKGIKKYENVERVEINMKTLAWLNEHASYDDKHPYEALEIIKSYVTTREDQEKVKQAGKRAMEYYAMALDACYDLFK